MQNAPQSRLTFREKVDVCWQKQLRDKYAADGVPAVPHLDVSRAIVRPVTRQVAEQIILKYEWLGTLPFNCNFYYGIFFGMYCAGVTCISVGNTGSAPGAYKMFGLGSQKEFAYLQRGANVHWSPSGANSKLVSWTCKLLAKSSGAKIIIAYSDSDAGEIGTIYQAAGWTYIGKGSSTQQWISPQGRVYDQMLPRDIARSKGLERKYVVKYLRARGWTEQASNAKGRYVCVLDKKDKALRALVEGMAQPYPKRDRGETDSAAYTNTQTGGASPTLSLNLSEASNG